MEITCKKCGTTTNVSTDAIKQSEDSPYRIQCANCSSVINIVLRKKGDLDRIPANIENNILERIDPIIETKLGDQIEEKLDERINNKIDNIIKQRIDHYIKPMINSNSWDKYFGFFVKNKLLVNIFVVFLVIMGLISSFDIRQEIYPSAELDIMLIWVSYPGASSKEVELNVTIPIEKELSRITGVREYNSFTTDNRVNLTAHLDYDLSNPQSVKDEIYRKISKSNISDIPDEVDSIYIVNANPKLIPAIRIAVTPHNLNKTGEQDLYNFVDKLEDKILKIDGVDDVDKRGYRDREIHINILPKKMDHYYLSLNDIVNSVKARNIRVTGGTLQSSRNEKNIIATGEFEDPMNVRNLIVRSDFEQKDVRIKDIATVDNNFTKEDIITKVNSKRCVILDVVKKEKSDLIETANNVKNYFEKNKQEFSGKYDIKFMADSSLQISSIINTVLSNAVIGFFLVILVLYIFLDLRTSIWTALGIPISLMVVLIYFKAFDFSINMISLAAIITVLGMLVDDGIIISEVIYSKREAGLGPVEASVAGVKSVIAPVTVTIITTIVAFLPMLSIKGMMGKTIYVFPLTITVILLASLLEATLILPNHLAHSVKEVPQLKKPSKKKKDYFKYFADIYEVFLKKALRYRYLIVLIFIVIFILAMFISQKTLKGFVLFWDDSSDTIFVNLESPEGTTFAQSELSTLKIENFIRKEVKRHELIAAMTNIGYKDMQGVNRKGRGKNQSQVIIYLVPKSERERTADDIISELRKKITTKTVPEFTVISYVEKTMGPPAGEAVNLKIVYENSKNAEHLVTDIESFLRTIPGVKDIDKNLKSGKDELNIQFNYEKLAQYGLTVATVAQTVRTAYEGTVASSTQSIDNKIDFRIKIDDRYQTSTAFLETLQVPNNRGRLIRLKEVASIKKQKGRSTINHYNGDRVITVTADVDTNIITSSQAVKTVMNKFTTVSKKYPGTSLTVGGEAKETKESFSELVSAFIFAIILVYFILVFLFESLSQPFVIMITLPFGIIGAILAFTAHGIPMTFMGVIGLIGLSGVVVNDNVIMVDFINKVFKKRNAGDTDTVIDQIATGARKRFRPILLTTITTISAMMPMVYGFGGESSAIVPAVMAMSYGLLFDTFLTLIFLPALYLINIDIKSFFSTKIRIWKS